ncbi:NADH (or F420H2) dehydrogenase subunit C [Candidatus Magnetoovum chiemensis]|nr:NADH (or F420H2) dehydrogenase subunit C [Candidatus Magnetoovum chiemensis]
MEPLKIAKEIQEKFPDDVIEIKNFRDQAGITIRNNNIKEIVRYLHDASHLKFDYLRDLCGVDYMNKKEPRFEVVYHFLSLKHFCMIRLNAQVSEDALTIDSIVDIYSGANWHERECFDMFGIEFKGHPDLRRILMPEDWDGYPLRKDYPTAGPDLEDDWQGYKEVLKKAEEYKKYEWKS